MLDFTDFNKHFPFLGFLCHIESVAHQLNRSSRGHLFYDLDTVTRGLKLGKIQGRSQKRSQTYKNPYGNRKQLFHYNFICAQVDQSEWVMSKRDTDASLQGLLWAGGEVVKKGRDSEVVRNTRISQKTRNDG